MCGAPSDLQAHVNTCRKQGGRGRLTENHIRDTRIRELSGANKRVGVRRCARWTRVTDIPDLASVCAGGLDVAVLRCDLEVASKELLNGDEVERGGRDHNLCVLQSNLALKGG